MSEVELVELGLDGPLLFNTPDSAAPAAQLAPPPPPPSQPSLTSFFHFQNYFRIFSLLFILITNLIFGSILFSFYVLNKPQSPTLEILSVDLRNVTIDNTSTPYSYNITIIFKISNPNPNFRLELRKTFMDLMVADVAVGSQSLRAMELRPLDSQTFPLNLFGNHFGFGPKSNEELRDGIEYLDEYNFDVYMWGNLRKITVLSSKLSYSYNFIFNCAFATSSPPDGTLKIYYCNSGM